MTKVATAVLSTTAKAKAREKKKAAAEGDPMDLVRLKGLNAGCNLMATKDDTKSGAETDVEMKIEETSPAKDGDISPINRSFSDLAEENKFSTAKVTKKTEAAAETRPNFSRVTPAQLAYITFPADGRYQPVRPVSATTITSPSPPAGSSTPLTSEKFAGGGGILILSDLRPEEAGEFIEFEPPNEPMAAAALPNGHAIGAPPSGLQFALDANASEANPPESFEVRLLAVGLQICLLIPS